MRRLIVAACSALALCGAGAAWGQDQVLSLSDVQFAKASEPRRLFPTEAARRGLSGTATVTCEADKRGELSKCRADSEAPRGMGFGVTAIAMAGRMKIQPKTASGAPVGGRLIRFPITFPWDKGVAGVQAPTLPTDAPPPYDTTGLLLANEVDYLKLPSGADLAAVYPARAQVGGRGGFAVVLCRIAADGWLKECHAVAEHLPGDGFGAAAEKIFSGMRVREKTKSGELTIGRPIMETLDANLVG